MSTVRQLFAILVTTVSAGLLTLLPASAAWAMLPPDPGPVGPGSLPTTVVVTSSTGGLSTWQVVLVAAVCVALAVLATLAVSRFLRGYRHGARRTAHI